MRFRRRSTTIGVLPTADVPASTVIQWSGSVRAALTYEDYSYQGSTEDFDKCTSRLVAAST